MTKLIVFAVSLLFSCYAHSVDGWSYGEISTLWVEKAHKRVLVTQRNQTPLQGCAEQDYLVLKMEDNLMFKEIYSALLVAYSASKNVNLGLAGCSLDGRSVIADIGLH